MILLDWAAYLVEVYFMGMIRAPIIVSRDQMQTMFSRLDKWLVQFTFSLQRLKTAMVLYFESRGNLVANPNHLAAFLMPCLSSVVDPPVTIYMGKDKFESRLSKDSVFFSWC